MRVVEYDRFGDESVLQLRDRPVGQPRAHQVLIRVKAAALNPKDILLRAGKLRLLSGSRFPKRVGYDWAGVVEKLGPEVASVRVGDEVFGMINATAAGAVAEQVVVRTDELALKPAALSFDQAAAIPLAALTALQALRDDGRLRPGQRVLINGASGGVGTFAVQIARELGAHVIAVTSAKNAELVKDLGANEVLDYAVNDPTKLADKVDVFFDVFGNRHFLLARRALTSTGTFVSTVPKLHVIASHLQTMYFTQQRARLVVVRSRRADLELLASWAQAGRLTPVIDRVVPMVDIAQAQKQLATKRTRGKIVIQINDEGVASHSS